MMRNYIVASFVALSGSCTTLLNVSANDSFAETIVGGIVLKDNMDITLDRENLYISRDEVRVDYLFTNTSSKALSLLVAFPIPEQDYASELYPSYDLPRALGFQTTVDRQPVNFDVQVYAKVLDRDVTQMLAAMGIEPNSPQDRKLFDARLKTLSPQQRKEGLASGLFKESGTSEDPYYQPLWKTQTIVTRQQSFPSRKTIAVSHRYKPLAGGSVGGNLNPEHRTIDYQARYKKEYCVDEKWLRAFDKRLSQKKIVNNSAPYKEYWIGYILSSGANWKGPIKEFRLVVDKGNRDNLVSFCADDVKQISATQFEVRIINFEPNNNLKILFIEWDPDSN